jgi:hypothetical protein
MKTLFIHIPAHQDEWSIVGTAQTFAFSSPAARPVHALMYKKVQQRKTKETLQINVGGDYVVKLFHTQTRIVRACVGGGAAGRGSKSGGTRESGQKHAQNIHTRKKTTRSS